MLLNSGSKLTKSLFKVRNKRIAILFGVLFLIFFMVVGLTSFRPQPESIVNLTDNELGLKKIVIDAGHGGKDPGTLGINGLKEKDVVYYIAMKLGKKIKENFPEIEVIYTRDKDEFIGLAERAKLANEKQADLFISVHANAAAPAAYGTESYVLGLHRTKENLETAKRENSAIIMEDNYEVRYSGFDPNSDESYIALSIQQSVFLEQSLNIASKVQEEFHACGKHNRGVKQAGFLVLYKTTMPSLLIEVGFVTNPKEGAELATTAKRDVLTNAIFKAFTRYKNEIEEKIRKNIVDKPIQIEKNPDNDITVNAPSNQTKTQLPENTVQNTTGIVFSVQIMSSPKQVELQPKNFKGLTNVTEVKVNNVYKYVVGAEKSFEKAVELQNQIRTQAYKDAFLVAFKDGTRIQIAEALKLIQSNP